MMVELERIDDDIVQILHSITRLGIKFEVSPPKELLEIQQHLFGGPHIPHKLFQLGSVIYQMGNPTMGELAKSLHAPHSTVTRMVTWLEDNGYAVRDVGEEDRRIVKVAFTKKGKQSYNVVTDFFARMVKHNLSVLTKEEQMILLTLLRKIAAGPLEKNQANITDTEIK
ncbi:MarR family winged helix-turn-helix transcriptional regulator [Chloroflexota bacterium]